MAWDGHALVYYSGKAGKVGKASHHYGYNLFNQVDGNTIGQKSAGDRIRSHYYIILALQVTTFVFFSVII